MVAADSKKARFGVVFVPPKVKVSGVDSVPPEEKVLAVVQKSVQASSATKKTKIKKKSRNVGLLERDQLKMLEEKNLLTIPPKHRFYNMIAEQFLEDGYVKGIKSFKGVYPTSNKLLRDAVYALMLDWFWAKRKQKSGAKTS